MTDISQATSEEKRLFLHWVVGILTRNELAILVLRCHFMLQELGDALGLSSRQRAHQIWKRAIDVLGYHGVRLEDALRVLAPDDAKMKQVEITGISQ